MVDLKWPMGAPAEPQNPAADPNPTDPVDRTFQQMQSDVMRTRSPFEPPADMGVMPRIVPRTFFRAAQGDEIRTQAEALAIQHDTADEQFNLNVDATKIALGGFSDLNSAITPEQRVEEHSSPNADFLRAKTTDAIAEMHRLFQDTSQLWAPAPVQGPSRPDVTAGAFLDHLSSVNDRALWAYRGEPSGGDGSSPINMPSSSLDEMAQGRADAELIRAGVVKPPPEVSKLGPGDAVATLGRAAATVGEFFDGKEFWKSVWTDGGAGIATLGGHVGDYDAMKAEATASFEKAWGELPRPAQVFIEQLNPGNAGLALAGGPLASVLRASEVKGAALLAGLVDSLAANPVKAVALQVLTMGGTQLADEATAGNQTGAFDVAGVHIQPVRVAADLAAGISIIGAEHLAERGIGAGLRGLDNFLGDAPAGYVDPSRRGQLASTIFPGLTPDERAAEMAKAREAFRAGNPLPESAAPKAQALTPHELMRLDYESAQDDLMRYTQARDIMRAADWGTSEGSRAGRAELAKLGFDENFDESLLAEGLRDARYDVRSTMGELSRAGLLDIKDVEPGMVGFARNADPPLALRAALGDGGVIKAGSANEMFGDTANTVMQDWREGDVMNARLVPGNLKARAGRIAGSKATIIPDVVPVTRPTNVQGVTSQATTQAGRSQFLNITDATTRAADLAAQERTTVPTGIAHATMRADAALPNITSITGKAINAFNQASQDPAHRAAQLASNITRSELATRFTPSRAQFIGRVRELFGSTDKLPDSIEYIGPVSRDLHGGVVAAQDYPTHGTIVDFLQNPSYYDADVTKYLPDFVQFDARNQAVTHTVEQEFGTKVGEFDTGIAAAANGGHGIFFPNYDAGVGKVARGHELPGGGVGSSLRERTFATLDDRLKEPDQVGFEPVTDIAEMFTRLDQQKVNRAASETYRYGVGGSLQPVPGWQEVAALENVSGKKVWMPPEKAQEVANWMSSSEFGPMNSLEALKNMHLGGDVSPLTIQGSVGWALSPVAHSVEMLKGMARGAAEGNILRPFTNEALYQDIAAAPDRWMRFFSQTGFTPGGGTPAEWRTGFLEKLPIVGAHLANLGDGMTNALMRGMESDFNEMGTSLIARGVEPDEAWGAASDMMKMGWLQQNFNQLGVPTARRSVERGLLTSTTFVRDPINFMANAMTGYAKLAAQPARLFGTAAQWATLTPREQLASQYVAKMAGTFTGLAATSALLTAKDRGYTPGEAIDRALIDVNGPDWMRLHLSKDVSVPLGGPFRSIIRAMAPGHVDGVGDYVPFAGMGNFIKNRVTTGLSVAADIMPGFGDNTDFYGNKIVTAPGLQGVGQALMYAAASVVPTVLGQPYQSMRAGETPMQAVGEVASQWFGQNPLIASQFERLERERRIGARSLYDQTPEQRVALGLSPEQQKAAASSQTLAQLRENIGSRAANALTELVNPAVAGAKDAYITDLHRRADAGDQGAEALIISVETQAKLQGLAQANTINGELDKVAYRTARGQVIDEMVGRSQAFKDVFAKMRTSNSPVDQASSEWYGLFDKAAIHQTVAGRDVVVGVDYNAFDDMEAQFYGKLGPDMAALVQQNVAAVPMGGGQAEVDLRKMRSDLQTTGYWDIGNGIFDQLKPRFMDSGLVPENVQQQAAQATTFVEYRQAIIGNLASRLTAEKGLSAGVAVQYAKSLFDQRPEAQAYNQNVLVDKFHWAEQHADDGIAARAIEWGYLSDSVANLIGSGAAGGQGGRAAAPATHELTPAETGITPPPPAAPTAGPTAPRSEAVSPPDLTQQLISAYRDGSSYGQLAIRHGLTEDAVRGRIRRATGDNPASLRA